VVLTVDSRGRRRFSWLAFVLALLILSGFSYHWYLQRHYSEHGSQINWYRSMVAPVFYALAVGLPLAAAIAAGRLIAIRRRGATIGATALTAATVFVLLRAVPAFTAWDAENGAMAGRTCGMHLRQLQVAMQLYAQDNDGRLPPGGAWPEAVIQLGGLQHLLRCPADDNSEGPSYALSTRAAGAEIAGLDADMPLFFDATSDVAPPSGADFRHHRYLGQIIRGGTGVNVVFAGGHVAWVDKSEWERRFAQE